jgi:tetratricopeptide (TPR) repeat protein
MRKVNNLVLIGAILLSAALASAAVAESSFADQLEMLEWSDPERAAQIIDAAPPLAASSVAAEIEMLEIRGMIYADATRDEDVYAVERRLEAIAGKGDESAVRAGRFVRAYSARQHSQFAAAEAELKGIDIAAIQSDTERYRVLTLRGHVLRILGQDEAALPFLERALDLANKMHDELRTLHSMLSLVRIYTDSGNFDRATLQLTTARRIRTGGDRRAHGGHRGSARRPSRGTARLPVGPRACETLRKQQMDRTRAHQSRRFLLEDPRLCGITQIFQGSAAHHGADESPRR